MAIDLEALRKDKDINKEDPDAEEQIASLIEVKKQTEE